MVLVSKKNRKILLYIVAVVASIFLLVGLIVILSTNDHGKKEEGKIGKNNYKIVTGKEYEDVTVITNDTLKKEHCLDDICIKDLTIYYFNNYNSIELDIINKGLKSATGYMKVVFGDLERTVAYKDLKQNGEVHYIIQLDKVKVPNTDDFSIRKLTKEEEKMIKG